MIGGLLTDLAVGLEVVQSFEEGNLRELAGRLKTPLVQLIGARGRRVWGEPRTYEQLATESGLRDIATYAQGVGPAKEHIVPRAPGGASGEPTRFVALAHAAGLFVHPYTFRRENQFLPLELRSSADPAGVGDALAEIRAFLDLGVDGVFTDNPDIAVAARYP